MSLPNTTDSNESWDNATWVLTSGFIIMTMQSGFGLLESGMVSAKNQTNIMVKNLVDIVFGGLTFWIIGYGIIFGDNSNGFAASTHLFTDKGNHYGWLFSNWFFQFSFCATATTIVSGCLAERTRLPAYITFSLVNTVIYAIPAHWTWHKDGWLCRMGVVDFAGCGPVHMVGGMTGWVGSLMIGPRQSKGPPSSLVNAVFGLFMLWWGWLGFNCGSTLGITGEKWLYASKAAVTTVLSTVGGGVATFTYCYWRYGAYPVGEIINGILGSLVSITGCCVYVKTSESLCIGAVGAMVAIWSNEALKKWVDDPVGAIGVHYVAAVWGMLAGGLWAQPINSLNIEPGAFYGGHLIGAQLIAIVSISLWACLASGATFWVIDNVIGLRMSAQEEEEGADALYHMIPVDDTVQEFVDQEEEEEEDDDDDDEKEKVEGKEEDVRPNALVPSPVPLSSANRLPGCIVDEKNTASL